jgi:hypothetical protein
MRSSTTLHPIGPGVDLVEALGEVSRAGEAWIDGTGQIEGIELRVAGDTTDPLRALKGRFTLLHLAGPSGGPYAVTLARAAETGIEVRGGVLVRARSLGVTLAVHGCHAVAPSPARQAAQADARARERSEAIDAAARPPAGPPAPVWARVAAANAAAAERDEEEEIEPSLPEAGDLVDHFAFGVCEVLTSDGDRLKIRDVPGPGRIREVSLSMLRVMAPTESEGKRMFRLVRKGPG